MSAKRNKKLRKEYRKEVEEFMKNGGLMELYSLIIKPKPRWMPKWMWMFCVKLFINVQEDNDA
jgi:hypothetical protein